MLIKVLVPFSLPILGQCRPGTVISADPGEATRLVRNRAASVISPTPIEETEGIEDLRERARALGQNPDWHKLKAAAQTHTMPTDAQLLRTVAALAQADELADSQSPVKPISCRLLPGALRLKIAMKLGSYATRAFRSSVKRD
jgi:hypothetical protein